MAEQLTLLADVARRERPYKRVRPTSVAQYAHLRDTGTLAKRRHAVLTAIGAIRNRTQQWPTACEVQAYLEKRQQIPNDGNPNHVKPRLTELAASGVLVRGLKRRSAVTGLTVLTWEVKSR